MTVIAGERMGATRSATPGGAFAGAPEQEMACRPGCGACCIGLSISSPIPGMPEGKPAGMRCAQLTSDNLCLLFGLPERPEVCVRLRPQPEMCGDSREQALAYLEWLEEATAPGARDGRHWEPCA